MIGINIIAVVILLGILIFVHELGHFLAAKYSGVGVLKFSLGFGPRVIGKKVGETEYLISAVPLGGYVKLLGESEGDAVSPENEKRSFLKQPVIKRIGIVAAGPFFNFLFAVLAFALIYMVGVPALTTDIGGVQEGSPAEKSGLREDDRILSMNGNNVATWGDIAEIITKSEGREMIIRVSRGAEIRTFRLTPQLMKSRNIFGEEVNAYRIGVLSSQNTVTLRMNPVMALWEGIRQTWAMTELTVLSVIKLIEGVISPSTLGGPILIAQMAGAQVKKGILPFIFFMAILSVNLGVLNLLPVPVLDGGHLLFYVIELISRREVNIKWREWAQQIGFVLLILLMLFVFYNDIMRIFSD